MAKLEISNLSVHAVNTQLVQNASYILERGELVALLGPNGAGKTSLLRASLGLTKISDGISSIDGHDISRMQPIERAKRIAYLPQITPLAWPNVVKDVIALGRFSHGANLSKLQGSDAEAVTSAIVQSDIEHLADRKMDTLSGGELARVHCARVFASQTPLLIADEPVAALDPRHQFRVMDLLKIYVDAGNGALVVLHDISLAARYATRLIWMQDGKIIADGPPSETLTEKRLLDVYGVRANINGLNVQIEGAV